jgi:hypothetical protein
MAAPKPTPRKCEKCWGTLWTGEPVLITEVSVHEAEELKRRYLAGEPLVGEAFMTHVDCDHRKGTH